MKLGRMNIQITQNFYRYLFLNFKFFTCHKGHRPLFSFFFGDTLDGESAGHSTPASLALSNGFSSFSNAGCVSFSESDFCGAPRQSSFMYYPSRLTQTGGAIIKPQV